MLRPHFTSCASVDDADENAFLWRVADYGGCEKSPGMIDGWELTFDEFKALRLLLPAMFSEGRNKGLVLVECWTSPLRLMWRLLTVGDHFPFDQQLGFLRSRPVYLTEGDGHLCGETLFGELTHQVIVTGSGFPMPTSPFNVLRIPLSVPPTGSLLFA